MNILRSSRTRLTCALALAVVPVTALAAANAGYAETAVPRAPESRSVGSAPRAPAPPPPPQASTQPVRVSAPSSRKITIGSPKGNRRLSASALEDLDVPLAAMTAYRSAARTMRQVAPSCGLQWTVLAAIGRVESNHGRYGGSSLRANGRAVPSIRGVRLDGAGPVAKVRDTDGGSLDGDKVWDRAVGPMQFLPSTWAVVGVDGDGNGVRSPDNINDAALAAAVYLCEQPGSLDSRSGIRRAVYGYNPSGAYVDLVTGLVRGFRSGDFSVPSATLSGSSLQANATAVQTGAGATAARAGGLAKQPGTDLATGPGADGPGADGPGAAKPASDKAGVSRAKLTKPPKYPQKPTFPKDDDPPKPPEPEPPVLVTLTGTLASCGESGELWCLDDLALDLGDEEQLAAVAATDLDADGIVETNAEELAGLAGQEVVLEIAEDTDPAVVYTVDDIAYRLEDGSFAAAPETQP